MFCQSKSVEDTFHEGNLFCCYYDSTNKIFYWSNKLFLFNQLNIFIQLMNWGILIQKIVIKYMFNEI